MIFIFFAFLIILFLISFYLRDERFSIVELIGLSSLLLLGISGLVPFICREFFNIPYYYSSFEILFAVMVVAFFSFVFSMRNYNGLKFSCDFEKTDLLIIFFASLILIRGFLLPMRGWDAYSLYDSRALMFLSGIKLSQMAAFSKYDEFNQFYYFSYPPMTSVLHTVMYANGVKNVMLIYAIFFVSFMFFVYLFLRTMRLNSVIKLLLFIVSTLNPILFQHTKLAYTNLPSLSFQFVSFYYLVKFANSDRIFYLMISALLLAFSNWTRSLEPFYLGFILAVLMQKKSFMSKFFQMCQYLFVSITTRMIWVFYIKATIGGLGESSPSVLELFSRIYDSLLLSNIVEVVFFIYIAYFPIILYLLMFLFMFIFSFRDPQSVRMEERMIIIIVLTIGCLIFGGTLYFSTTFSWWNQIPDSLLRSSLILVPLVGVLSGYFLERVQLKVLNLRKKGVKKSECS